MTALGRTALRRRSDILALIALCIGGASCGEERALDSRTLRAGAQPGPVEQKGGTAGSPGPASVPIDNTTVADTCDGDQAIVSATPQVADPMNSCPCSRAPGRVRPPSGWTCPAGTGATAEATIGPQGGALSLTTGTEGVTLELDVPAGALTRPTLLKVTELRGPTPAGYTDYSPVYKLEPTDVTFAAPAKLRLPWSITLRQGVTFYIKNELSIYFSACAPNGFERLADSYVNAGFSQATLTHTGYVFAGYPASLDPAFCTAP